MGKSPFVAPREEPVQTEAAAAHPRKIAQAKAFLQRLLADGPRPATEVLLAAAKAGIAEGTLYTAKRRLRVPSQRQGYEEGQWVWVPPTRRAPKPQGGNPPPL
jgi:hypothetical protein